MTIHKYPVRNSGFEDDKKCTYSRNVNDEKLENNVIRAKMKVFEYAYCNEFDYYVTLTLNKNKYDRYNLNVFIKDLGQFIRDYRKKHNVDVQYLLIPEKHEDGAWHMHGLIKGIPSDHLVNNENGYLDWLPYKNKFGYISISPVKNQEAVSKYITKYVSKDFGQAVTEKNRKLYYVTRGLRIADVIKKGTLSGKESIPFQDIYENEYVKTVMLTSIEGLSL